MTYVFFPSCETNQICISKISQPFERWLAGLFLFFRDSNSANLLLLSQVDVMKLNKLYECGKNGAVSTVSTTMAPLVSTELPGLYLNI